MPPAFYGPVVFAPSENLKGPEKNKWYFRFTPEKNRDTIKDTSIIYQGEAKWTCGK